MPAGDVHGPDTRGLPHEVGELALEALDALPHAVVLLAPRREAGGAIADLRIEYANPAAGVTAGVPREVLQGLALQAVLSAFPPAVYALFLEVLESGRPQRIQQEIEDVLPGGQRLAGTFDIAVVRLREELLVLFEDVSGAAESRRAEERYRALLEATPDWVSIADGDGHLLYINPGGRRMVGLAPDAEVLGRPVGSFSPPWVRERTVREVLPAARRDGFWQGDLARLHREGREIPVSQVVIAGTGEDGEIDFYATIARDTTGQREADLALRQSEERFRVAFERAPIGIALTDLEGRFVQVNDAYCETVRRRRSDLVGRTVADLTHPDDVGMTVAAVRRIAEEQMRATRYEKRYLDPDGEPIWVEVSLSVFPDRDGHPQFLIGQVQDVGERRVAHVLQRSMLTTRLPRTDDLDVAVRYLPASADAEVSGDWYDVIELPGGRIGIAVGDVVGRGVEAAGTMSQLRTAVRAYAMEGVGPAEVLVRMQRLVDRLGDGLSTTLVLLELDLSTGELSYVSAGHLPPALLGRDGTTRLLGDGRSTPLGTAPLAPAPIAGRDVLRAGETILLYTDGLVERREDTLDARLEQLREALARAPEDLERLLDHMVGDLLGTDPRHDDVALLAVRPRPHEQEPLEIHLGDGAAGLAGARAAVREWLGRAGAGEQDVTDILLAAGEACANSVEHADGAVELRARRRGREVTITVRDHGAWHSPEARPDRGHGLRLMRMVMDDVRVVPTGDGTHVQLRRTLRGQPADAAAAGPERAVAVCGPGAVHVTREGGVPVARMKGEVDLGCVGVLRAALEEAVAPGDRGLVIDLGGVEYLDSAGMHLLHDLARVLLRRGQRVRVVAPRDPGVTRALELIGLGDSIGLDATVAEARDALA